MLLECAKTVGLPDHQFRRPPEQLPGCCISEEASRRILIASVAAVSDSAQSLGLGWGGAASPTSSIADGICHSSIGRSCGGSALRMSAGNL